MSSASLAAQSMQSPQSMQSMGEIQHKPKERYMDLLRRAPTKHHTFESVISGVFNDFVGEMHNKFKDPQMLRVKGKILAGFWVTGLVIGHTYCAYRGFYKVNLWARHLMASAGIGTLFAIPVCTLLNIHEKQFPNTFMLLRGAAFGSLFGYALRANFRRMLPWTLAGAGVHGLVVLGWHQLVSPIYYYHLLAWPDYKPPRWWPSQPLTGLDVYLDALRTERLNVTYPEDLHYFKQMDEEKEAKLKLIKATQFEQEFLYNSEVQEKEQLDEQNASKIVKPKNLFHL